MCSWRVLRLLAQDTISNSELAMRPWTSLKSVLAVLCVLALAGCQTSEERAEAHFASAQELIAADDPARAMIELRNALKLVGTYEKALATQALLVRQSGNGSRAFSLYQTITELYAEHPEAHLALAELALEFGEYEEAQKNLLSARKFNEGDPRLEIVELAVGYRNALIAEDGSMRRDVAESAKQLQVQEPTSIMLHGIIIDNMVREGLELEALDEIARAKISAPGNLALYQTKLEILARRQDFPAVETELREMLKNFPENSTVKQSLIRYYLARGDLDAAEKFLREQYEPKVADDGARVTVVRFLDEARGRETARSELDALIEEGTNDPLFKSMRATMNYEDGFTDTAITELTGIVEAGGDNPQNLDLKVLLARMLDETGNEVGARALIEEVLLVDARQVEALKVRANWLIDQNLTDEAIIDLRKALDQEPNDPTIMTITARAHLLNGNRELAGEVLALAVQASGSAPDESMRYARFLVGEDRLLPAEGIIVDALRITPNRPLLLKELADIYVALKDWPRAEQVERTLRSIQVERTDVMANDLRYAILQAQEKTGELEKFLRELADTGEGNMGAEIAVIRSYIDRDEIDEATLYLEQLRAERPSDRILRFLEGALKASEGNHDEAVQVYRALLSEDGNSERVWLEIVRSLNALERSDEADAAVEEALSAVPDSVNLRWMQASIMERNKDYESALQVYESLYNRNSATSVIANNLASLLSTLRDDEESIERAYRIARRLRDSDFAPYQDTYGWIAFRRGDLDEALRNLEPAAETLADDPLVQFHLGMTYARLNMLEKAIPQLEKTIALALGDARPQFQTARSELRKVKEKLEKERLAEQAETEPTQPE
ncbi:MAG: tetratricopeptide (TPR) repeat protein [Paracoccaceae bacterium]|jgi:tetratricopeptide (TPR) repeat protein